MTLTPDFNSSVNVPFQRMRALLSESGGGLQEGVLNSGDLKVAQRGAGANMSVDVPTGAAWVQIDSGTRNGLGHVYNDATANVAVTASNATNPRIDQIILRWNDSSIPTGSGNVPTLEVLTGTATAGAQAATPGAAGYRAGAAALPNDCLRLADILVPATSTSVTTANIVDRRPWARGARFFVVRRSNASATNDYVPTANSAFQVIDATNLSARIECSGVPMVAKLMGTVFASVATTVDFSFGLDGATLDATNTAARALNPPSGGVDLRAELPFTPAAGSHVIAAWAKGTAAFSIAARADWPLSFIIEESVRPNASNT